MSEAVCTNLPENCGHAREGTRFRAVGGHTTCPECGSRAMVLSQSRIKLPVDVPGLTAPKRTRSLAPVAAPPAKPAPSKSVDAPKPVGAPPSATATTVEVAVASSGAGAPAGQRAPEPTPVTPMTSSPPLSSTPAGSATRSAKPPRRSVNALTIGLAVLVACVLLLWFTTQRSLRPSPAPASDTSSPTQNSLTVERAPEAKPALIPAPAAPADNAADDGLGAAPPTPKPEASPDVAPTAASPSAEPAPAVRHVPVVRGPTWERRPTAEEIAQYYPEAASEAGQGGRVTLRCRVTRDGLLVGCEIASEDPPGLGFGEAALRMTRLFRMSPKTVDGEAVDGAPLDVPISFLPDH